MDDFPLLSLTAFLSRERCHCMWLSDYFTLPSAGASVARYAEESTAVKSAQQDVCKDSLCYRMFEHPVGIELMEK